MSLSFDKIVYCKNTKARYPKTALSLSEFIGSKASLGKYFRSDRGQGPVFESPQRMAI